MYFFELGVPSQIFCSDGSLMLTLPADELALLFTGSEAPAWAHTKAIPPSECSTDAEGEDPASFVAVPTLLSEGLEHPPASPTQGQKPQIHPLLCPSDSSPSVHASILDLDSVSHPLFSINQLGMDRRLIVNRKRKVKMYRVWVQGIFKKI